MSGFKAFTNNRWLRSGLILLGLLMTASAYSNWQPMFLLLNNMGAYTWVCTGADAGDGPDFAECDKQYNGLTQIYSTAGNMAAVSGLVGGTMMDIIGARWTMLSGSIVMFSGWLMLLGSSEQTQMYWPGLIFLGIAENLMGFPGFKVGEYFPKHKDLGASLCIAAQMLSSWMPIVIWAVVDASGKDIANQAIWVYLAISLIPVILMVMATPGKKTVMPEDPRCAEDPEGCRDRTGEAPKGWPYWKEYLKLMCQVDFILFTLWYVTLVLGYQFFNTKIMQHSGQEVGELIGVLNPFRAAIGPVLGLISDKIGSWPVLIIDNILIILAFAIALIPGIEAGKAAAVLYIIGRSFCFTTKYIFIQNFYPKKHFGKLSGALSLFGGLFGFLNVWFVVIDVDTQLSFAVFGIVMAVIMVIPIYLWIKAHKLAKRRDLEILNEPVVPLSTKDVEYEYYYAYAAQI